MRPTATVLASILLLGAGSALAADGIPLKPGKWEIVQTQSASMMPETKMKTSTHCVTEERFDPVSELVKGDTCKVLERGSEGNKVTWKIECKNPGGMMTGDGEFSAEGDSAGGRMGMKMIVGVHTMEFETAWTGKHLGSCD